MKISSQFKNLKQIAPMLIAALLIVVTPSVMAFSPERQTYTVANPASKVVLNSITDNPRQGDERSFFSVADSANTSPDITAHQLTVADGQVITLRAYVNNDAKESLNGDKLDGEGIAKNVKVRIALPTSTGTSQQINAYVSADNADPKMVSDTVNVSSGTNSQQFSLSYEAGSARLSNNAAGSNGIKLSDDIVKDGAQIGYDKADGKLPAWFQYAGVVTVKAKVHTASASSAGFKVDQTVALTSAKDWSKNITATPKQQVKYSVGFTNNGNAQADNVTISDTLPTGTSIVKGSAKLFNATNKDGKSVSDDVVTDKGVNIGSYAPTANGYLEFNVTMPAEDKLTCGDNNLTNTSKATVGSNSQTDTTVVKITKQCATPPATTTPAAPATPSTPATPAPVLANTGPGSVIILFLLAAVAGTVVRHSVLAKRFSSQN